MTREEYLNKLIQDNYPSVRQFANEIGVAPTTLRHILSGGLSSTSLDKIEKICHGLGIEPADLLAISEDRPTENEVIVPLIVKKSQEQQLVHNYRTHTEMQAAVNKLLDLHSES